MAVIPVQLAGRSYNVLVEHGLRDDVANVASAFLRKDIVPIVADANAKAHHGERLEAALAAAGRKAAWFEVASGEASKSWQGLQELTDWLLAQGVERGDHVFALGGGVVGDLTGFACAILKRGCGFVQIPTTLLAQVDSGVGGKTAINTAAGKNLIGAFHQPALVLIDPATLDTLPDREMRAGYAEVIKYGILGDREFFDWLAENGQKVVARDPDALVHAISTSVAAKARIVAEDERETSGARALLNLGHTFGHALEAETGFSDKLLHGEGVALGMVLAARYSARRGLVSDEDAALVARAIAASGLPSEISQLGLDCDGRKLADHMLHDKKMESGTLPFILLRSIGAAYLAKDVALDDVASFLDEQLQ
ncbi:MAG: 3-dehydroquinate synthase [Altererythrobacter sp.]|nr:3-dehydroquinate synthase [Altererythrobacter sp.]MBT8431241.1 3-dehydroquinate synthase [Altererythrobacter sp.]NNE49328.1 3-dehydroquinate synthase [Altererythrobacter sp.]NNF94761.1 3-dehydroquinate synthase [Altererythrobacter sp.]NNK45392.1 3-dehydroquinate synthase [Altererythrobacter sp.]